MSGLSRHLFRRPAIDHSIDRGRVAQLDRVLASEAKGRGFESRLAHHVFPISIPQARPKVDP